MLSPGYRRKAGLEAGLCGHLKELSEPLVFLEDHPPPTPFLAPVWGWLPTTLCD